MHVNEHTPLLLSSQSSSSSCLINFENKENPKRDDEPICAVCFEGYVAGREVKICQNSHEIHEKCLKNWLQKSRDEGVRMRCLLCRATLVIPKEYQNIKPSLLVNNSRITASEEISPNPVVYTLREKTLGFCALLGCDALITWGVLLNSAVTVPVKVFFGCIFGCYTLGTSPVVCEMYNHLRENCGSQVATNNGIVTSPQAETPIMQQPQSTHSNNDGGVVRYSPDAMPITQQPGVSRT